MDNILKLSFIGDIMCLKEQIAAIKKKKETYDVIFDQVKHLWKESDYVVGNLETPIAGKKMRYTYEDMRFNAPDELGYAIKNAGVNFVSLANNHILDRGVKGLNNTISMLDKIGLEHTGAYVDKESAADIFVKEVKGVRVAFISCTYGVNQGLRCSYLPDADLWKVDILKYPQAQTTTTLFLVKRFISNLLPLWLKRKLKGNKNMSMQPVADSVDEKEFAIKKNESYLSRIVEKIRIAKHNADIVVVLPHIGGQYCKEPGPWQKKITEVLIASGADIIVSNHAHVPLEVELRDSVLIAYGLGDFCSYLPVSADNTNICYSSIMLEVEIDIEKKKLRSYTTKYVKMDSVDGVTCVRPVI